MVSLCSVPFVTPSYPLLHVFKYECFQLLPFRGRSFVTLHPVVSPLSFLLIHRPSHPIPLFSAVLSHLTQATAKYNIYL